MPPKTGVKVKLGGKQRTLRYTSPSLRKLEEERAGEALSRTLHRAGQISISAIASLVWAGLLHDEPKLTVDEAAEMIEPPLMPLIEAVMEALAPWTEAPDAEGGGAEGNAGAAT